VPVQHQQRVGGGNRPHFQRFRGSRIETLGASCGPTAQADRFESQNRLAAELILRDVDRSGGERSLAVRWARAVLQRVARGNAA
jgi:hypothetical protein